MGNLALHSAEEPDNLRATTGTVEVPTERDNNAALALGARPIQQHEPAARHTNNDNLFDKVDSLDECKTLLNAFILFWLL